MIIIIIVLTLELIRIAIKNNVSMAFCNHYQVKLSKYVNNLYDDESYNNNIQCIITTIIINNNK